MRSRSPERRKRSRARSESRSSSRSPRPRRRRSPSRSRSPRPRADRRERAPREAKDSRPEVGAVGEARVLSVKPYGAFVEFEGCRVHGLVHISQLSRQRVESVEEVVSMGDRVKVKVLDSEEGKLSLSMKAVNQETGEDLGGEVVPVRRRHKDNDEAELATMKWGTAEQKNELAALDRDEEPEPSAPKVKPNFEPSGKLAEDTNKVNGVILKWAEPRDAQKPSKRWRLYVFKGKESLEPYLIHRQSGYLLGRDRRVADIPLDHPSCTSQHAVIQFRVTQKNERDANGKEKSTYTVRPYLMDLGSTNGTYINGDRIESQKYVELLEKDVLRFGYSSREYVILHDGSRD
ncbi:hypothetical protein AB1Y20_003991 [Prymnesium parvum]|uniref:FHA domain-containing protein n=1 Tax=Prymnesium parvum TaxID=97485 RepID=A0AB34J8A3_PRYPA